MPAQGHRRCETHQNSAGRRRRNLNKSRKLIAEGAAAASAGMHGTAERLYRKVLARDPGNLDGHYLLGTLLAERGDLP